MKLLLTLHATMSGPEMNYSGRDVDRRDRNHGFSKCGFHFVIQRDGVVCQYRKDTEPSIHDERDARDAISVCLVGGADGNGAPENNFTLPQWETVKQLIRTLRESHPQAAIRSKTSSVTSEHIGRILGD